MVSTLDVEYKSYWLINFHFELYYHYVFVFINEVETPMHILITCLNSVLPESHALVIATVLLVYPLSITKVIKLKNKKTHGMHAQRLFHASYSITFCSD